MAIRNIACTVILAAVVYHEASAQTARRKGPIIRQADRILIESGDPKSLFNFFADTLLLPVAWPITDTRGFISGALGAGNVNLEFFRRAEPDNAAGRKPGAARYAGIAFEPYPLPNSLREMQVAGIPYAPPEPYISTLPKGTQGVLWTTVALPYMSRPGMSIFLYEYSPEYLRADIRRNQLGNRLVLNGGGPLGLQAVSEIVIESTNLEKDKTQWALLLGTQTSSGSWRAGAGPAIRLIPGEEDRIQSIVFKVESIARAKEFLIKNRLGGSDSHKEISFDPSKVQGLNIRAVE